MVALAARPPPMAARPPYCYYRLQEIESHGAELPANSITIRIRINES